MSAINFFKKTIRSITPHVVLTAYHALLSYIGHILAGMPSKKMVVIGVTGTKGKTSTANFIWSVLNAANIKTCIISTANIRIGGNETLNYYHMTMPGRFAIPSLMKDMVKAGCSVCVVETTSEGLKQQRHRGIVYDIAVFTNLTPEHLPSHNNSFEEYKQTKGLLFKAVQDRGVKQNSVRKTILGRQIPTAIITNADSEHMPYYAGFGADTKVTYSLTHGDVVATAIKSNSGGTSFTVGSTAYTTPILGTFNVYNILPALIIGRILGAPEQDMVKGIASLAGIPGRMQVMTQANSPFMVIVDYAHEKQSMNAVLDSAQNIRAEHNRDNSQLTSNGRIIVLLGAEGGGRDPRKRFEMGEVVAHKADIAYVTNVDPYEDDPKIILEDIAQTAEKFGKVRNTNLFVIEDRTEAITHAISNAKAGDIILVTGKGAEQSMIIGGKSIAWDDRKVVEQVLLNIHSKNK